MGLWEDNIPLDDLVRLFTHFQGQIQRIGIPCGVAMPIGRLYRIFPEPAFHVTTVERQLIDWILDSC